MQFLYLQWCLFRTTRLWWWWLKDSFQRVWCWQRLAVHLFTVSLAQSYLPLELQLIAVVHLFVFYMNSHMQHVGLVQVFESCSTEQPTYNWTTELLVPLCGRWPQNKAYDKLQVWLKRHKYLSFCLWLLTLFGAVSCVFGYKSCDAVEAFVLLAGFSVREPETLKSFKLCQMERHLQEIDP